VRYAAVVKKAAFDSMWNQCDNIVLRAYQAVIVS
jgi:hypothetical protein